jgi:hypothetical protein
MPPQSACSGEGLEEPLEIDLGSPLPMGGALIVRLGDLAKMLRREASRHRWGPIRTGEFYA